MSQLHHWRGLVVVIDDGQGLGHEVVVEARRDGALVWRTVVATFVGDELMPRGWLIEMSDGHIVVGTDAEHSRGGGSQQAARHKLSITGERLGSMAAEAR
jgi:hypothetical protein